MRAASPRALFYVLGALLRYQRHYTRDTRPGKISPHWSVFMSHDITLLRRIAIAANSLDRNVNEATAAARARAFAGSQAEQSKRELRARTRTWFWRSQSEVSTDGGGDDDAQDGEANHDHDLLLRSALTDR